MTTKKHRNPKLEELRKIFTNKKVIIAIVTTIALLILFRLGSIVPMPFITIKEAAGGSNSLMEMINLLGGGGLSQVSMFAIGISPYITAQIIMQLLSSDLIPPLSRLSKSGERGRKKIEVYTRILTLPLAAIQAYAILMLVTTGQTSIVEFSASMTFAQNSPMFYFFYITLMISGTYISIFLADLITKRGAGNGVTMIILAGILSSLFSSFQTVFLSFQAISGQNAKLISIISSIVYVVFYILLVIAVIFVNGSVRKIPIQQVGQSLTLNPDELSYLPLKVNTVGVIPVIFASSLMTIPSTIAQFLPTTDPSRYVIEQYVSLNGVSGIIIYFILILFFTFFYSYVQLNPEKISKDFKKSGRFIPGIKMGRDTEKHITKTLFRVNWIGAPFLGIIAAIPYIASLVSRVVSNGTVVIPSSSALGGTGLVIIVTAAFDFWSSIQSTATTTSYTTKKKHIENNIEKTNVDSQLW